MYGRTEEPRLVVLVRGPDVDTAREVLTEYPHAGNLLPLDGQPVDSGEDDDPDESDDASWYEHHPPGWARARERARTVGIIWLVAEFVAPFAVFAVVWVATRSVPVALVTAVVGVVAVVLVGVRRRRSETNDGTSGGPVYR
ncbi:MAG: hypothetical protein U5R31_01680 [Acidimicrobiia bacterium]|nr:hypothetical protein [Acidimicrobiia bacterium]